jgi:hypothetical protein
MVVAFLFIVFPGINGNPIARFVDMVYGRAARPFVYRTLLPSTIRLAATLVPDWARQRLVQAAQGDRIFSVAVPLLRWEWQYLPEYAIAAALIWGCFLGYAFFMRNLARRFLPDPGWLANVVPVVGLLIVPAFFRYNNHIYDAGALVFFAAALACLAAGRTGWFYLCFALASANKETAILLAGVFILFHLPSMPKRRLALHAAGQVALWGSVKAIVTFIYRGNPGTLVEFHLIDRTATYLRDLDRLLGFVAFAGLWVLLLIPGWRRSAPFLRRGLVATLAPLVTLALVFGYVDETRMYLEALPLMTLILAPTLAEALGAGHGDQA